ncbi:unnamed protein product [Effrenium voratum]|nr:unnamed protein product [Effrenium voratum]
MSAPSAPRAKEVRLIMETVVIGGSYILISASLIAFNKHLMSPSRFPYAKAMTAMHMLVTSLMSLLLYTLAPSLYPSMGKARENWRTVLQYILPLGSLFAVALYCSNRAYYYSTVAFLQFCKEGSVAIIFTMSCLLGLQAFSWNKVGILSIVVAGCCLCAHGEINFVWTGFALQITSQLAECSKNIIGEVVMSGAGMKLDVLTFVLFQAPCSLAPLALSVALSWEQGIWEAFLAHWPMILLNALNAFALNLLIATALKRLSAVAFVIIGIVKDSVIVAASSMIFGDHIPGQQQIGFVIIMTGIAFWSHLKLREQAESEKLKETAVLVIEQTSWLFKLQTKAAMPNARSLGVPPAHGGGNKGPWHGWGAPCCAACSVPKAVRFSSRVAAFGLPVFNEALAPASLCRLALLRKMSGMKDHELKLVVETVAIGGCYILISASLIAFNKYLMNPARFPYAKAMTAMHMLMTTLMSLLLYTVAPSLYPSMGKARENWRTLLKYILPLGMLFAVALYCSNRAYLFSTVAFLQFCKEGNVALIFAMSCVLGLQVFTWNKVGILSIVVAGCSLCAHGEINFVWMGFALQITSQLAECSKNLIGEVVMSGAGLKLDVLTFVMFQAPCSLAPLALSVVFSWEEGIWEAFLAHWPMILLNALNAFALNVVIATTLKRLSAVAFVIIGIVKDSVIVATSSLVFGDHISSQQQVGFVVILTGIAFWSHLKLKEQAEHEKLKETEPLAKESARV